MAKTMIKINKARFFDEFSEDTIKRLSNVLHAEFDGDEDRIDDCLFGLYCAKSLVVSIEQVGDPKLMKRRYTKALSAIKNLENALIDFDVPEMESLKDLIGGFEDDEILAKFDVSVSDSSISNIYGVTIYETRQQLVILGHTIQHALNRIIIRRGAKPKEKERYLAVFTKEALEERDVKLSSYDDGIFFTILGILFEECFDNPGPEAHRRHGAYALDVDLVSLEEHDIKYMPPGSVIT